MFVYAFIPLFVLSEKNNISKPLLFAAYYAFFTSSPKRCPWPIFHLFFAFAIFCKFRRRWSPMRSIWSFVVNRWF